MVKILAGQLRAARAILGLNQREMARMCGTSQTVISYLEIGNRRMSQKMMDRIIQAMKEQGVEFTQVGGPGVVLKGKSRENDLSNRNKSRLNKPAIGSRGAPGQIQGSDGEAGNLDGRNAKAEGKARRRD